MTCRKVFSENKLPCPQLLSFYFQRQPLLPIYCEIFNNLYTFIFLSHKWQVIIHVVLPLCSFYEQYVSKQLMVYTMDIVLSAFDILTVIFTATLCSRYKMFPFYGCNSNLVYPPEPIMKIFPQLYVCISTPLCDVS